MKQIYLLLAALLLAGAGHTQVYDKNGYPAKADFSMPEQNQAKPVYDENVNVTGYVKKKGDDYELYDENMNYKGVVNDYGNRYEYERYGVTNHQYDYESGEYKNMYEGEGYDYNDNSSDTYFDYNLEGLERRKKIKEYKRKIKFEPYDYCSDGEGGWVVWNRNGDLLDYLWEKPPKGLDYVKQRTEEGQVFYIFLLEEYVELMERRQR